MSAMSHQLQSASRVDIKIEPEPTEVVFIKEEATKDDEKLSIANKRNNFPMQDALGRTIVERNYERYVVIEVDGMRLFECTICKKRFSKNEYARRHHSLHNLSPFVCEICGHEYTVLHALKHHLKSRHKVQTESRKFVRSSIKTGDQHQTTPSVVNLSAKDNYTIIQTESTKTFKCKICQKTVKAMKSFNKHFRVHTGEKPFSCSLCDYRYMSKDGILYHLRVRHNVLENARQHIVSQNIVPVKTTFVGCEMCNSNDSEKCFGDHVNRGNESTSVKHLCSICDYRCKSGQALIQHIYSKHIAESALNDVNIGETQNYSCRYCKKPFNRDAFEQHICIHLGVKKYSCPHCDYKTWVRRFVSEHIKINHSKKLVEKANGVEESGSNGVNLDMKMMLRTNLNEGELGSIDNCSEEIYDQSDTKQDDLQTTSNTLNPKENYIVLRSGSTKLFKCKICDKVMKALSIFNNHFFVHTQEKPFSCCLCDDSYMTPQGVVAHLKVRHNITENARQHVVRLKSLPTGNIKTTYTNCEQCKPRDPRKCFGDHIDQEERSSIRKHLCSICYYRTENGQTLIQHVYTRHLGEYSSNNIEDPTTEGQHYSCRYCKKPFFHGGFEEHMRIHIGVARYTCLYCDYKTYVKHFVSEHIRTKHSNSITDSADDKPVAGLGFHQVNIKMEPDLEAEYKDICKYEDDTPESMGNDKTAVDCEMDEPEFVYIKEEIPMDMDNEIS